MNNEFTKINNGKEVRYVLEDGGSITTGAVATVEKSLGELQRRAEPPKPRNFVAKNAKMGGAGKMKDKSKTIPRHEKHKKPVEEGEANISDRELDTIDPQDQGEEEGSFVKNQIHTMLRVLTHLEHAIGDEEDLPEWVQMKLSQAQQSVVGIMDYMISDKEREVERQTGHDSLMKENVNLDNLTPDEIKGIGMMIRDGYDISSVIRIFDNKPTKEQIVTIAMSNMDNGIAEGSEDKIKQLKADHATAVHWSNNGKSPQQREAARQKAEKIKSHLEKQYKQGVVEDPYFNMLERSVSQAQHNLMVGVAHNPQFAQNVKVKQRVGQEFANADQGHDISALPIRVPKKK